MATKLNTIVFSIVVLHLLLSAQMHPIHLESPAPQPQPPQSQPSHHNSSQYGTTQGSLQPQGQGVAIDAQIHNTRSHVCSSATNVVASACVYLQVHMVISKSVLATTTGRLSVVDQNALDFNS
ncbi:hypothetical protein V5N11_032067 [Cardamine amara subsp. amara]|uniref:Uncharacterized protein n=1 Tax=Cardamine amara subsp. amara TaxID=228776 RepID=A0ABD0ZRK9_CARAN